MRQYLDLLYTIKNKGTNKPPARTAMPGTRSYFGYQFRHDLSEGFPLLTTKKMFFKGVVTELLWFLKGDTNIKYLVDNGVNIWNEDAYNYYLKNFNESIENMYDDDIHPPKPMTFEDFIRIIKDEPYKIKDSSLNEYTLGDCGYQYGRVWRDWTKYTDNMGTDGVHKVLIKGHIESRIDQIADVIKSLRNNPESRRHLVTAIDPAHQDDLALYWCHALFQFNCRPIEEEVNDFLDIVAEQHNPNNVITPKYYLDCQLYQRSADTVLGVPFNIASYALLIHIIAKMCNMIPGDFVHTFGDVHIYHNHWDAVNEQLTREPRELPKLLVGTHSTLGDDVYKDIDTFAEHAYPEMFAIKDYNPHPAIKAELSTGLTK
jgi:thymidylate synthase